MTGARFLLSFLALPLLGLSSWALPGIARLAPGARVAVATAAGALLLAVEMFGFQLLGIRWSLPALAALPLLLSAAGLVVFHRHRVPDSGSLSGEKSVGAIVMASVSMLLASYAVATARATSVDLLLFWGSRGARFAAAGGIEVPFLADSRHRFMHPDYPPLVTFLYAWGTLASGRFPWGAALLTMPFFLTLAVVAFWSSARDASPASRRPAEHGAILAALLALVCVASLSAGNAEPTLLFFETLALSAIVFGRGTRTHDAVLALGLAGATWTKIEGAAFAALAGACFVWLNRREPGIWRRLLRVAGPAALLLACWLAFAASHGLLQGYVGATYGPFSMEQWRTVLSEIVENADYGVFYLPWVVVFTMGAFRRRDGGAGAFLAAAAGFLIFIVFSYMREGFDPTTWIQWSAPRLLMTPLLFLFFAAVGPPAEGQPGPWRQPTRR